MKTRMFIGLLAALLVAALAATQPFYAAGQQERDRERDHYGSDDLQEKEEINQTYQLAPGARVDVSGINGKVEIETSNSNTAEVHIIRSARTKEDLQYHKIIIEPSANSLVIRGENNKEREGRNREVRHEVLLKLPRQIQLGTSGVNGRVTVGEIDGPVNISGINGRVEVAQAAGYSTLSGINGRVKVTLTRMNERGVSISGINGGVELAFTDSLNADLDVSGINGSVDAADFPMTIQGKMERHSFRAKIGSGGAPINVSGVNGKVRITRAGRAG